MQSPVRAEFVEGSPEQAEGHERMTAFGWEFSVHPSTSSTTRVVYGQTNGKFNRKVIYDHILIKRPAIHRPLQKYYAF
jgi:hypothetical protein